jgi:hypothetical protein
MTGRNDFTDDQWKAVLEGPTSAGLLVIASDRGGSIRESFSMAKAYSEAREGHGESELLDTIVSTKPEVDRTKVKSPEELKEHSLQNIRDGVALIVQKGTKQEIAEYKQFIRDLANKVAEARKEGFMGVTGDRVSDDEKEALAAIEEALG